MFWESKHQRALKAVRRFQLDYRRFDCHPLTAWKALAYLWETLLSAGSYTYFTSCPRTSPPFLPPHDSRMIHEQVFVSCSNFSLNYFGFISVIYFWSVLFYSWPVCDGQNWHVIFFYLRSGCKTIPLTKMWSRSNVTAPWLLPLIAFEKVASCNRLIFWLRLWLFGRSDLMTERLCKYLVH